MNTTIALASSFSYTGNATTTSDNIFTRGQI